MIGLILALAMQDDLDEAKRLMKRSEELLHELRVKDSLPVQEEILRRLEKEIEEAREAESKAGAERKPAERTPGKGERALRPYEPERKTEPGARFAGSRTSGSWGHLNARQREAILQSLRNLDQFPPEYRPMMEAYYRGLADPK